MAAVMNWSHYQEKVFEVVRDHTGNVMVEAVAGSGKTVTLIEAANRTPNHSRVLFLAFNKAIAAELRERITRPFCTAQTFHSYGLDLLKLRYGQLKVDFKKKDKLIKNRALDYNEKRAVIAAVSWCQNNLVFEGEEIYNRFDWHDYHVEEVEKLVPEIMTLWDKSKQLMHIDKVVDFDDMISEPVLGAMTSNQFDLVFVDEVQDLNKVQRELVLLAKKKKGRVIAVGDRAQAIYAFRGADNDSLQLMERAFDMERYPLNISYRCDKAIVQEAQQYVPQIEAREDAGAGIVRRQDYDAWDLEDLRAEDMVICRRNAPLVSLALRLLRNGIPFNITTPMEQVLKRYIRKVMDKDESMPIGVFWDKVKGDITRQVKRAEARGDRRLVASLADKEDCVGFLVRGALVAGDVLRNLERIFDKENGTRLSSIHKAKGLEAERVFFLFRSQIPGVWVRTEEEKAQENNLVYVGITRAEKELIYVE